MVPRIPELGVPWTTQKYRYVPGVEKVWENVVGGETGPPFPVNVGLPVGITLWNPLTHLQVTVVPAGTVTLAGSKRLPLPSVTS